MRMLPKTSILLALLLCAGCAKPSDAVSVARRDHLLAGPHGWIDVTLHAPEAASSAASGKAASAAKLSHDCGILLSVDGETMLSESGDLAQADAASNPLGYRFVVPAGTLDAKLAIMGCVKDGLQRSLSIPLAKDHVASLEFDGRQFVLKSDEAYSPMSMDTLHADVAALQQGAHATDDTLSRLTRLALASVLLNAILALVAVVVLLRRRRG